MIAMSARSMWKVRDERMAWFKYVWIVLLAIYYLIWTFGVWLGMDEKCDKGDWIAIHLCLIFLASFIYFGICLLL